MHKLVTFGHIGNNSSHLGDTLQLRVGVTGVTGDWTSYGYLRKGVTGFGNCSEWVPSPVTPVTPVTLVTSHSGYQSLRLPVTLVTSHSGYQSLRLPVTLVTTHSAYRQVNRLNEVTGVTGVTRVPEATVVPY